MTYDVELREMAYVLAAAEERNFTRAGERCFISQPALSKVVKKVERELGVVIFNRTKAPLEITPEGEELLKYFREMMVIQENLASYCENAKRRRRSELLIGAPSYFCTFVLPDVSADFNTEFPDWNVRLLEANPSDMLQMIESNALDLGICVGNEQIQNVSSRLWQEENLILSVPRHFSINKELEEYALEPEILHSGDISRSSRPAVPLCRFRNERFILMKKGNDGRTRIERMCAEAGFTPTIVMEMDQLLTAFTMSATGAGICVVRAGLPFFMEELCSQLTFYKLGSPEARRPVQILCASRAAALQIPMKFADYLQAYKLPN